MGFEEFVPRQVRSGELRIAILPSGSFWVGMAAAEKFFREYERASLLYDKEREVIGIRPSKQAERTYSLSRSKNRKNIQIAGQAFFRYFEISHEKRTVYEPTWNDKENLVEIDLTKPLS